MILNLQNGKNWSSLTEEDSLSLATEKPDEVVLVIEEDSGKPAAGNKF